jgi:ATP-dependent DNA helicase RecG
VTLVTSLASIVRRGPLHVEVLSEPSADALAESLVAFANTDGGAILLGVDPSGEATGDLMAEDADNLLRAALARVRPLVRTETEQIEERGGLVVAISVPRSSELHGLIDGRMLARTGEGNVPMDAQRVMGLATSKATLDFEKEVVVGATWDDLDPQVIDDYIKRRQERVGREISETQQQILRSVGALTSSGEITVAGILLFGKDPQTFLPQSGVTYVRFHGKEPQAGYARREEFTGALARIIEKAGQVLVVELRGESIMRGLKREDHSILPLQAVREALVNAISHREYRLAGRRVEIRQYEDRLEIISPGSLPAYITLDNMVEEHFSRNSRVVKGLYEWKFIEELGLGIDLIYSLMQQEGHPPPEFRADEKTVVVTLRRGVGIVPPLRFAPAEDSGARLNERQVKAIQYLKQYGRITNREYRDLCPDVSTETLRLDLADLVDRGAVLKIGDKKGTFYMLK